MRPLRLIFILGLVLACVPGPLASQTAGGSRMTLAQPAVDPRLVSPLAGLDARVSSGLDGSAAAKRPWWAFPAAGLVAGGALGAFVSYRECQNDDCIGAGGLAIVGAGAGAIVGLLLEGGVRALR
jgi:hypothetical protein